MPTERLRRALNILVKQREEEGGVGAILDAQMLVLDRALSDEYEAESYSEEKGKPYLRGPSKIVPLNMAALALADAILEGES